MKSDVRSIGVFDHSILKIVQDGGANVVAGDAGVALRLEKRFTI
jgi:hypothetical protein